MCIRDRYMGLDRLGIKGYIVTAGLRAVITNALDYLKEKEGLSMPSLEICGSEEKYDESGYFLGFKNKMITITNKAESLIPATFPALANFSHAIVLGDAPEDFYCVGSLPLDTVVGIGFDNYCDPEVAEKMKNTYDIIVHQDGDLAAPLEVIKYLADPDSIFPLFT
eukprot:TRINITY_DN10789_c0_g1_i3.p2 TRINITY_DN10789_c0_g1~~TRINITY_DN10789_c0_g1_i3.p2  ORF type:complete len:166 (+),score=31.94 TRINITY_DN10789_c0_g1_i3:117-614(+)